MLAMSTIPLIVLVFAVTSAVSAQQTAARTNADVDRTTGVRRELAEIQHDLAMAESSVRGFVLTGQERMREDYDDAVIALRADLDDLDVRLTEPLQRNRLEPLDALVEERLATLQGVLRIGRERTPEAQDRLETFFLHGQTNTSAIRGLTEQMELTATQLVAERIETRDGAFARSYLMEIIAMPAAIFVAMILMASFTGGIVKRVGKMGENAYRLDKGQPMD